MIFILCYLENVLDIYKFTVRNKRIDYVVKICS